MCVGRGGEGGGEREGGRGGEGGGEGGGREVGREGERGGIHCSHEVPFIMVSLYADGDKCGL